MLLAEAFVQELGGGSEVDRHHVVGGAHVTAQVADVATAIGADLTLGSAVAGLATIALVSIGSLSVMIRLVREGQPILIRAR